MLRRWRGRRLGGAIAAVSWLATGAAGAMSAGAAPASAAVPSTAIPTTFLGHLSSISTVASAVPANGDVNPYGLVVVPQSVGRLHQGDTLVSNFNNGMNQQGTGTTIVEITPGGTQTPFATVSLSKAQRCPGGVGLTTALAVFRTGWVVVGSLPTTDGTSGTAKAGCLIVLDANGAVVETIAGGPINGPWDMTAVDFGPLGALFVTNVLNGTVAADPDPTMPGNVVHHGTVVRLMLDFTGSKPMVTDETVVGSGFGERTDPGALVVGPTGVGYHNGILYVADTVGNRITAIPGALGLPFPLFGPGIPVTAGGSLNGPLGLTIAPNGDILTVNGGDGVAVETAPHGGQVATKVLDSTPVAGAANGAGTLFGLAVAPGGHSLYFVDDGTNTLNRLS